MENQASPLLRPRVQEDGHHFSSFPHTVQGLPAPKQPLLPLWGTLAPSRRLSQLPFTLGPWAAGPSRPRDSLRSRTRPRRRCPRSRALQSQRCRRNWCWHSAVQAATPRPMESMASGCRRHSCRCRLTRPGTLSHITRDEPTAPMYLREGRARAAPGARSDPRHRLLSAPEPSSGGSWAAATSAFLVEILCN